MTLIPADLHMARVDVTQPVSGVMAEDAPRVLGDSQLGVVETRLHVTPLPHQSAESDHHQDPGLTLTYLTSPSSPQSRQMLSLKMILTGPVTLLTCLCHAINLTRIFRYLPCS